MFTVLCNFRLCGSCRRLCSLNLKWTRWYLLSWILKITLYQVLFFFSANSSSRWQPLIQMNNSTLLDNRRQLCFTEIHSLDLQRVDPPEAHRTRWARHRSRFSAAASTLSSDLASMQDNCQESLLLFYFYFFFWGAGGWKIILFVNFMFVNVKDFHIPKKGLKM